MLKRHLLGLIALGLVLSGLLGLVMGYSAQSQAGMAAGVGLRAGLVLGALWIAYPQLLQMFGSVPRWLLGAVGLGIAVAVLRPQYLVFVAIVIAVLGGLQFASRLLGGTLNKPTTQQRSDARSRTPSAPTRRRPGGKSKPTAP
ncbi:MAG: hypothetical protein AB7F89_09545 [Pirellulaceae bacterium]